MSFLRATCFTICLTCFAGVFFIATPALAVDKIAVVNVQKIMSESKAALSIQSQLSAKRDVFQKELSEHEQILQNYQSELGTQRERTAPDEELLEKQEEFEKQLFETRKLVQSRRRLLEKAAAEALTELREKVLQIVAEIADKEQYELVITRQNVVLAQKSMDITDTVMKMLDKNISSVKLNLDAN